MPHAKDLLDVWDLDSMSALEAKLRQVAFCRFEKRVLIFEDLKHRGLIEFEEFVAEMQGNLGLGKSSTIVLGKVNDIQSIGQGQGNALQ